MIIRVFPRRTSFTPGDSYAFVGDPPLWRPEAERVDVSCVFTWDVPEAERLVAAWGQYYPTSLGGPAVDDHPPGESTPGKYVKHGVVFTTRGCIGHCPWCLVPEREGELVTLPVTPGHIIQDNNLLAAPLGHVAAVFKMLRAQSRAAVFSGGLAAVSIDKIIAEELLSMRIASIFLAADTDHAIEPLRQATELLAPLGRNRLRCYALLGFGDDTPERAEKRLKMIWEAGCLPFAQLYQPPHKWLGYGRQWRELARNWSRPAIMRRMMGHPCAS